ncbi:MAG TPA: Mur ligase family protein [Methanobacterium sp.]
MDKMNVAVLGLGIEGRDAVKALLDYGCHVYGSDINKDIVISEFVDSDLDLDLGHHNTAKIDSADAVVLSPSLWHKSIAKDIIAKNKLISDVLTNHKSIFTIGVTGTNGKTTTCYMLKEIFEKSGLKVLLGGNAGGGFEGYTKLILEASMNEYDIMVVEVCDMTLDYTSYIFNFDMVLVTNIGSDHMDYHISLENYRKSVCRFLNGKKLAVLNENDGLLVKCADCADKTFFFGSERRKLKLFGEFNQENASGAFKAAELLGISSKLINKVLSNFKGVVGRTTTINFNDSKIIIGKTDNIDAVSAVFNEVKMDVIIIGTPRKSETFRYNILKEVSNAKPALVVLFPGLDDTTDIAEEILRAEDYDGDVCVLNEVSEVVELALKCTNKYKNIFIGGNGQKKIMYIQKALNKLSHSNNIY